MLDIIALMELFGVVGIMMVLMAIAFYIDDRYKIVKRLKRVWGSDEDKSQVSN